MCYKDKPNFRHYSTNKPLCNIIFIDNQDIDFSFHELSISNLQNKYHYIFHVRL